MKRKGHANMIDFTPTQSRTIAAGLSVLSFAVVLAFVLFLGWTLLTFLDFASSALIPVVLGLFLAMLFKPYYEWFLGKVRNPSLALTLMLVTVLVPFGVFCWFGGAFVFTQVSHLVATAPTVMTRLSGWVGEQFPRLQPSLASVGLPPEHMLFFTDPNKFSHELIAQLSANYGVQAMKAGVGVLKYFSVLGTALVTLIFFAFFVTIKEKCGEDYVR